MSKLIRKRLLKLGLIFTTLIALPCLSHAETGLPWSSSFENGNNSEWNGFTRGTVSYARQNPDDGTYAAYTTLVANTLNNNYLEHYFGDHVRIGLEKVEEVYLEFSSKFEQGYTFPERQGHKLALINLTDGNTTDRRYQVYIVVDGNNQYAITYSDIGDWTFRGLNQNVGTRETVRFDQWDRLKMYVRLNTPGSSDGIVRMWINGELKLDHSGLNLRENTDYGMNKLILSSYTAHESGSNGMQWYDHWILSETDPVAGDISPPSPPLLQSN